jgi:hypothetical protein
MDIGMVNIMIVVINIFRSVFIFKYIVYDVKRKEHPVYINYQTPEGERKKICSISKEMGCPISYGTLVVVSY